MVVLIYWVQTRPRSTKEMEQVGELDDYLRQTKRHTEYYTTAPQTAQLARLLIHNAALLSPEYVNEVKSTVPLSLRGVIGVTFLAPLHGVTHEDGVKAVQSTPQGKHSCALPGCPKRGTQFCSRIHKTACTFLKHRAAFNSRAAARGCVVLPIEDANNPKFMTTINWHSLSANSSEKDKGVAKNIHGRDSFIVKVQRNDESLMVYDQERSFQMVVIKANKKDLDDRKATRQLDEIVLACERWAGTKAFLNARRVGDALEFDVNNLPVDQGRPW
ncbi:hypothetical protein RQP46_009353 [Phenoliferia psychrophenolica]